MFEILDARYGEDGSEKDLVDVTDLVKKKISSDRMGISFGVSPNNIGIADPAPGQKKVLVARYSVNGQERSERIRDGDTFAVSVPQTPKQTPAQAISTFYAALWSNFAGALFWFLQVMGFAFAWELGKYFGNSYLWVIVNVLFAYASYWLIPVIVIIGRAIGGTDFIRPFGIV